MLWKLFVTKKVSIVATGNKIKLVITETNFIILLLIIYLLNVPSYSKNNILFLLKF